MKPIYYCGAMFLLGAGAAAPARSAGTEDGYGLSSLPKGLEPSAYHQGLSAVVRGDFDEAIKHFEKAKKDEPENPEIYNMLAYAQRKNGMLEEALANYKKALELKPDFPQAREYLGEAHLQAALRELETLKGYGKDGQKDYETLKAAIVAAAKTLAVPEPAAPSTGPKR